MSGRSFRPPRNIASLPDARARRVYPRGTYPTRVDGELVHPPRSRGRVFPFPHEPVSWSEKKVERWLLLTELARTLPHGVDES